ncbi:thioesterase family protein [Cognatishimia sp. F0-27]|uniref:acyl-CoA thioesterase n=1 Tax=Cognatishimia sp. F0-27 TaxID=2816855 RepID=UPI001D0CC139|nr:acyl-CoA thioesterase [Cognatishimia sp. F0-27]MCC1493794.1 acyl-CoA thioesterase [Cognatishimia sp. F0-27]
MGPVVFRMEQKVLFKHCDPAGIVFYPRIFEMVNDCIEAFFDEALGVPFETLHVAAAVPTVRIETVFHAPSRHGDVLGLDLAIDPPGRTSLGYCLTASCNGDARFTTQATLVHVGADMRPHPWPDTLLRTLNELTRNRP